MSATDDLTQQERELLWSVEEQGLRAADIARTSDLSASTVRTVVSRARRKRGAR